MMNSAADNARRGGFSGRGSAAPSQSLTIDLVILEHDELVVLLPAAICHADLGVDRVVGAFRRVGRDLVRRAARMLVGLFCAVRVPGEHATVKHAVLTAGVRSLRVLVGLAESIRKVRPSAVQARQLRDTVVEALLGQNVRGVMIGPVLQRRRGVRHCRRDKSAKQSGAHTQSQNSFSV